MSAILELKETPESCGECQLRGYNEALDYNDHEGYAGAICHGEKSLYMEVSDYLNADTRHPDCPLKITEDNLRWIEFRDEDYPCAIPIMECAICKETFPGGYENRKRWKHCPSCGIKLLPPEEGSC